MAEPFDTLMEVQLHDTAIDQLRHRIETLPERAELRRGPAAGRPSSPGAMAAVQAQVDDLAARQRALEEQIAVGCAAAVTRSSSGWSPATSRRRGTCRPWTTRSTSSRPASRRSRRRSSRCSRRRSRSTTVLADHQRDLAGAGRRRRPGLEDAIAEAGAGDPPGAGRPSGAARAHWSAGTARGAGRALRGPAVRDWAASVPPGWWGTTATGAISRCPRSSWNGSAGCRPRSSPPVPSATASWSTDPMGVTTPAPVPPTERGSHPSTC